MSWTRSVTVKEDSRSCTTALSVERRPVNVHQVSESKPKRDTVEPSFLCINDLVRLQLFLCSFFSLFCRHCLCACLCIFSVSCLFSIFSIIMFVSARIRLCGRFVCVACFVIGNIKSGIPLMPCAPSNSAAAQQYGLGVSSAPICSPFL